MIPRVTEATVHTKNGWVTTYMAVFGPDEPIPNRAVLTGTLAVVVGRGMIWWNGKCWTLFAMKFGVGDP